jgi:DNA-binding transcriptional ArsR family regulator
MKTDAVDDILEQWSEERPELETESLGVVVRIMSLSRAFLRQATEALAPLELELFEYDVLSALRRQGHPFGLPATGLAKETGLSSGAMTNRIDKLEERGLVSRNPDVDAADESLQGLNSKEIGNLASLLRKIRLTGTEATEDI